MVQFKKSDGYTSITLVFLSFLISSFIVIRHDRKDEEYLTLGKSFTAVCKIGEHGGDGTLISPKWLVTAAHVAEGLKQQGGKIYFQNHREGYEVEQIYIHAQFKSMGDHDVALIKLKRGISDIQPCNLYRGDEEKGKEIIIVGHGDTKTGNETTWKMDGRIRAATNRIDDVTHNHIIFSFDKPGSASATELEGTAGRGDSGGPAFILEGGKPLIAGISSAGFPGENGPGTYGAIENYTRVSTHTDWIDEMISGKIIAGPPQSQDPPNVLDGLGLILSQGESRIDIEGKIDPEVPVEFRHIMFGPPPSFLVALNEKEYEFLEEFSNAFQVIRKGESYTIEFSVRGEALKFKTIR